MAEPPPLRVYPELWRQSREQFPDNWQDQFRCLCALARDYRREHRAVVKTLPEGERLFLQALDQYDVEEMTSPKGRPGSDVPFTTLTGRSTNGSDGSSRSSGSGSSGKSAAMVAIM
jgi:hypothetical protein